MDEVERSLRDHGFLSPVIADFIPTHRKSQSAWFVIAEKLNAIGQRQIQRGADKTVKLSSMDPLN